jgi:hypothetical protein
MRVLRHLVLLLLLFPSVAFANPGLTGFFFGNTGGTMTFDPTTDTLSFTSTITTIIGYGKYEVRIKETGGDFGTITVTTGPLISGSIFNNALFDGGTITLMLNTFIDTASGTLIPFTLSGTLNTPLNWWVDKFGHHHLSRGLLAGSGTIDGRGVAIMDFYQVVSRSGTNQYNIIQGGITIPEPGTVVLVVTGLGFLACRTKSRRRLIQ